MKKRMSFIVVSEDVYEVEPKIRGQQNVKHICSKAMIIPDNDLEESSYTVDGQPTKEGTEITTRVLLNAVVGNIHYAHQKGFRDSAEHLRFFIAEMEKLFIEVATIQVDDWDRHKDDL